jgi:aerobic-type carbon monoxide dehydrogenase small subunit (CoxS/CutS family)
MFDIQPLSQVIIESIGWKMLSIWALVSYPDLMSHIIIGFYYNGDSAKIRKRFRVTGENPFNHGRLQMIKTIQFNLNDKPVRIEVDDERTLLWVLRTDLGLTGAKFGCGEGLCGACTVLVDDEAMPSCQISVGYVAGREIKTIEGLAKNGQLHPIQKAFIKYDALQCGFCTPGMILKAYSLLVSNPKPTRDQIISGMDDNLCRCGAHVRIVKAIQTASEELKGGKP